MSSSRRRAAQQQPRIAEQGHGWHVEYDPATGDYSAIVERDERGYIGSRRSCSAAAQLARETLLSAAQHGG